MLAALRPVEVTVTVDGVPETRDMEEGETLSFSADEELAHRRRRRSGTGDGGRARPGGARRAGVGVDRHFHVRCAPLGRRDHRIAHAVSRAVRVEVVGVGTELLLGQIANTNARWIGERLAEIGADVLFHQVVGDNLDRIVSVLEFAASRTDVVIATGGLGPTEDDITRDAIARVMDAPLDRDPGLERWLRERFAGFGAGSMPENNLRQADVPRGARTIENDRGSAPGLVADLAGGVRIYALPGVPAEMIAMMRSTVLPELGASIGAPWCDPAPSDAWGSGNRGSPRCWRTSSRLRRTRASPISRQRAR